MLASIPSQHLESDYRPCRNPKRDSTSTNHALVGDPQGAPTAARQSCSIEITLSECRPTPGGARSG